MTLMGGPIDTRRSPTAVNLLAQSRGSDWFRKNCIHAVPYPYPGASRDVYPGFLQLSGFMAMNFGNHLVSHWEMFKHLVEGDEPPVAHGEVGDLEQGAHLGLPSAAASVALVAVASGRTGSGRRLATWALTRPVIPSGAKMAVRLRAAPLTAKT